LQDFNIRRLARSDSLDDLTSMLHRAFSGLGRMGLNCAGIDQTPGRTGARVRLGECLVAVCAGRIVGTATLHKPERRSACCWYRRADVASLHQFAVDPSFQGTGCGVALLRAATGWASEHGYLELALETPSQATHLLGFYRSQGFRVVDELQFPGRSYRSSVLSRSMDSPATAGPQRAEDFVRRQPAWCGVMVAA